MGTAKRDLSGVFNADLRAKGSHKAALLGNAFRVNRRGITFTTDVLMPEWTEMNVKMQVPVTGTEKPRAIQCHAVVVQCEKREGRKGYQVALLFLDLPKRDETRLELTHPAIRSSSISISR